MDLNRRSVLSGAAALGAVGIAGCFGDEQTEDCPSLPQEPAYGGWLEDASNYEETCDFRDEDEVEVDVGVRANGAYWGFGPAAVAVSPGATVHWTWTGRGGAHDVYERNERFASGKPIDREGETFEVTFDEPGVFKYACHPHQSQGMKGIVFVALE